MELLKKMLTFITNKSSLLLAFFPTKCRISNNIEVLTVTGTLIFTIVPESFKSYTEVCIVPQTYEEQIKYHHKQPKS